jgi:hypothetical protein
MFAVAQSSTSSNVFTVLVDYLSFWQVTLSSRFLVLAIA